MWLQVIDNEEKRVIPAYPAVRLTIIVATYVVGMPRVPNPLTLLESPEQLNEVVVHYSHNTLSSGPDSAATVNLVVIALPSM